MVRTTHLITLTMFLGDLRIGPNSTLVFSVNTEGSGLLIVKGCLYLSNGSQVALSLDKEPGAGQYEVANAACVNGKPLDAVKVRLEFSCFSTLNI